MAQFTREQLLAQSFDRHLAVTASAGSGKTSVLVQRYAHLLLSGVDSRKIVAITFTRKAAAEMTARVAKEIENRLARATEPKEMSKLRTIRERLTSAKISTIHSFCSQLLRDFPIEAGVAPNFTELTTSEGIRLRTRAATSVLEDWLAPEHPRSEETRTLFRTIGRKNVLEYLQLLLRNSENMMALEALYSQDDTAILAFRDEATRALYMPAVQSAISALNQLIRSIDRSALKPKKADEVEAAFVQLGELGRQTARMLPVEEMGLLVQAVSEMKTIFFTTTGQLRSEIRKIIDPGSVEECIREFESSAELIDKKGIDSLLRFSLDEHMLRLARMLYAIAREAMEEIDREKNDLGAMDFDDLQLKARVLLTNESVREKLRRKIRYLMIDEFQDTNQLQYDIAKALVSAVSEQQPGGSGESTNLFIVGDAKQSIYGFRGADVRVFEQAQLDIQSANWRDADAGKISGEIATPNGNITANSHETVGDIRLSATFRLLPAVAGFVNLVCGRIMPTETDGFDVQYEPMVCARQADELVPAAGSVTMLLALKRYADTAIEDAEDEPAEFEEDEQGEAELLARHIAAMTSPDNPLMVYESNNQQPEARPARFGDIAVLARSRSKFDALGTALRRLGIPFVLHGGRGFFSTQEVSDMRSYLSFLHNTENDLALAAVLRSPFFACNDSDLYAMSTTQGATLWDKMKKLYTNSTPENPLSFALRRSHDVLDELLPLAPRMPIPMLLRLLLERSGWRGMILDYERAAQMEANIEKLIDYARAYEQKGFRNLYDFVEELTELAKSDSDEGEAVVETGTDAVNLMTIHGSKGLEFPIVALYQTNSSNSRIDPMLVSPYGITFPIPEDEHDTAGAASPLHSMARHQRRTAETAELKRLLYVALTRAKDHIVISGTVKQKKDLGISKITGLLELIFKGIDRELTEIPFNSSERITVRLPVLRADETGVKVQSEQDCELHIQTLVSVEQATLAERAEPPKRTPTLLVQPLRTTIEDEYFSASQMMVFEDNPKDFTLLYRLGLASEKTPTLVPPADGSRNDSITGTLLGTYVHEVLSRLGAWLTADGEVMESALDDVIAEILATAERHTNEEITRAVRMQCTNIASTELVKKFAGNLINSKQEYELLLPIGVDFLTGVLDVLVQNTSGDWEIWDWKTNKITPEKGIDVLFEHYRLQLECYIYFAAQLFPQQEHFTARLLFSRLAHPAASEEEWTRTLTATRKQAQDFGETILTRIERMKEIG